ncbi:MAG: hypothetical protein ACFE9Z_14385 [Promethearchaeota archaeon]
MTIKEKSNIIVEMKTVYHIEISVLKCKERIYKIKLKRTIIDRLKNKFNFSLMISYIVELFYLYLLRKNLYRILDKSIKEPNFRKLIKTEILKAPIGTFSEFFILFNDLKREIRENSTK